MQDTQSNATYHPRPGRLLARMKQMRYSRNASSCGISPEATPESVENAFRLLMALSGSTNAVVHLAAIAGRVGVTLSLDRINALSDETPVLVDLKPVGEGYMEDFFAAGGVPAVLRELRPLLNLGCIGVDGLTLRERLDRPAEWTDRAIIRPFDSPVSPVGGLVALRGSLAPDGAILKRAAATPSLFEFEGHAVVFDGLEDLSARIDDPALDVTPDDVLVLKNAGPQAVGMPEAGYLPIPAKLARAGVKDMARISDARMSGTAYGTIVLHTAPEAAAGGPLAVVRNGDSIALSVKRKRIDLLVEEDEIRRRLAAWSPPAAPERGYKALYRRSVLQAPQGVDFDFLASRAPAHG